MSNSMESQRRLGRRARARSFAVWIALCAIVTGCGWSDQQRRSFLNDCLTNAHLDDDVLRSEICQCWLERISELYSLDELNGGGSDVVADNERVGQECARDHGVEAYFPPLQ
jgi:hypothetical protein